MFRNSFLFSLDSLYHCFHYSCRYEYNNNNMIGKPVKLLSQRSLESFGSALQNEGEHRERYLYAFVSTSLKSSTAELFVPVFFFFCFPWGSPEPQSFGPNFAFFREALAIL